MRSATPIAALPGVLWDVVVIGAGPAGAFAAMGLARAGHTVLLVDREMFPRYKVCGCCLNGRALRMLRDAGLGDVLHRKGALPLDRFLVGGGGARTELGLPEGAALSRAVLDDMLAGAAVEAGATFCDGTVASVSAHSDSYRLVRLDSGGNSVEIEAKLVVLANGLGRKPPETIPEFAALPEKRSRLGAGAIAPGHAVPYESGVIYMACGAGGYVGLVRLEDGRLNAAATYDRKYVQSTGGLGAAACAVLDEAGFDPIDGLAEASWRGTPLLTRRARTLGADRCLLLGDATGYVEPFTGEGMAWAFETAQALTPLARRALESFDESVVADWTRTHRAITRASQRRCRWLARALRHPELVRVGVSVLDRAPALARPFVKQLNHPVIEPRGQTL